MKKYVISTPHLSLLVAELPGRNALAALAINYLCRSVFSLCCVPFTEQIWFGVLYSLATDVRRSYGPIPLIHPHSLAENLSLFFYYPSTTTFQYQF